MTHARQPHSSDTSGYLATEYAASFSSVGEIVTLPHSGLSLIRREIRPGLFDLIGLYPYSMCQNFAALPRDMEELVRTGAVALSFVGDPFAEADITAATAGWALSRRFKTHFVLDLSTDWRRLCSQTIRRYTRKGYELQSTEIHPASTRFATQFWQLYLNTIRRRNVTGLPRLSEEIITRQMTVPSGYLGFAKAAETITGAILCFVHPSHVSAHLICFDDRHYNQHTSYILIDAAAAHAQTLGARFFNIGGPAGASDDPEDGLYQFKRRWTPHTRASQLCGCILDPHAYAQLCAESGTTGSGYFPAYRQPGSQFEWQLPDL